MFLHGRFKSIICSHEQFTYPPFRNVETEAWRCVKGLVANPWQARVEWRLTPGWTGSGPRSRAEYRVSGQGLWTLGMEVVSLACGLRGLRREATLGTEHGGPRPDTPESQSQPSPSRRAVRPCPWCFATPSLSIFSHDEAKRLPHRPLWDLSWGSLSSSDSTHLYSLPLTNHL